jgi:hypothetical protein
MIRDGVLDAEFAEPAIGQVHLYFATDQPLRADRKDIAHDQHPDHQFRIDRRASHRRIVGCKLAAKPPQIERRIDPPHQMIFGHSLIKMKLVEQLTLVTLQTTHHRSTPPRFASTQRNHRSRHLSTDFCNKIGTNRTSGDVRLESAFGCRAELRFRGYQVR